MANVYYEDSRAPLDFITRRSETPDGEQYRYDEVRRSEVPAGTKIYEDHNCEVVAEYVRYVGSTEERKQQWALDHGFSTWEEYNLDRNVECMASGECGTPEWDCRTECNHWAIGVEDGYENVIFNDDDE